MERFTTESPALLVFLVTLAATFAVSALGRLHSIGIESQALSNQRLSKWLIGLSAGAAANSGFIVTGAVGLGYSFGVQWLLLPLGWLLGDIAFWIIFPHRINAVGREAKATTLADVITFGFAPAAKRNMKILVAVIVLTCLAGYVSAQWLAGQKFLTGAFDFPSKESLLLFAALILLYTLVGGFRGSVYVDSLQAIIRVIGTMIALAAVALAAVDNSNFEVMIQQAGPQFLTLFPQASALAALAFVGGYAAASLGFGLGQPQIVTRYLAGASPKETRAAWWIYIGFVQFTWIAMTVFGVLLRGVIPHLADPEAGLSVFFSRSANPVLTGIIVADIFATIAATSNSLLVAMGQTAIFDLLGLKEDRRGVGLWSSVAGIGIGTMFVSTVLNSTVATLALSSVSLMGAGLAPPMIVRVLNAKCSPYSLAASVLAGLSIAACWKIVGLDATINEAAPGILGGLIVNFVVAAFTGAQNISSSSEA